MKQTRFLCLMLTLLLLCSALAVPVLAAGSSGTATAFAEGLIENPDGVLTETEVSELQALAKNAAVQIGANVGILFTDAGNSENRLMELTDRLYDRNCDPSSDAIILAVDISSRKYYIRTIGHMNDTLSGRALDRIEDQTTAQLAGSNWNSAALTFIGAVGTLTSEDFRKSGGNLATAEVIVILIALAVGFAVAGILAYRMNNARRGKNAANYVKDNSFSLNKSSDIYLYSTVTKTKIETSSGSGGGSSGGSSRGGRGGSF